MLTLSRNVDEAIIIGNVITIRVLSVRGNRVRLGVEAPQEVSIHREEIQIRINEGNDEHRT